MPSLAPTLFLLALAGCSAQSERRPAGGPPGGSGSGSPSGAPTEDPGPPNLLLVVVDDLGVDKLGAWGLGTEPPPTPVIDGLIADGVRFERVWANPVCSPSRAALLTGQHGFRTGVGMAVQPQRDDVSLATDTWTLPKALAEAPVPYASVALGKWHLGTWSGDDGRDPLEHGFLHHAGSLANLKQHQAFDGQPQHYFDWELSEDGVRRRTTTYATSHTVDATLAAVGELEGPWFAWVAFNAVHGPWQAPPAALWSGPAPTNDLEAYDAMLQVLDAELGRLLDGLGPDRANTVVVLVGDNGTPQPAVVPPFSPTLAKGTPYEGGVRVPLVVWGPAVGEPGSVVGGLASHLDLYATLLQLGGLPDDHPAWASGVDSVSLAPLLADPGASPVRELVYTERFGPNGSGPRDFHERAISDQRYKLVTRLDGTRELYDLAGSWLEGTDLLQGTLTAEEQAALVRLEAALVDLTAG